MIHSTATKIVTTAAETAAGSMPLGRYQSLPIVPLAQLRHIPTNQGVLDMVFWGTRNPNGNVDTVTEAQVLGIGSAHDSVHVFFDAGMHPVLRGGSCRAVRGTKTRVPTAGELPCKDPTSFRCQMFVIGLLAFVAGAQLGYYVPLLPLILFLSTTLDPRIPQAATAIDVSASIVAGTDGVAPRYESPPQP